MMKLLRVLTGVHAGAEIHPSPGTHRIGAGDECDIRLSDWQGEPVLLTVEADGLVAVRRLAPETSADAHASADAYVNGEAPVGAEAYAGADIHASIDTDANVDTASIAPAPDALPVNATAAREPADDEPGTVLLVDFVPMQFGDTALCIGPADAPWPTDLDLLSTLLVKPHRERSDAERSQRRKVVGVVLACGLLASVIAIGSILATTIVSRAAPTHDPARLADRLNRELAAAHLDELHAQKGGERVHLTGMVANVDDDTTVRHLLANVPPNVVVREYDIAQNDARNIEESLATPGVQVHYAGHGRFDIAGRVADPKALDAKLAYLRRDFSPNIRDVRVNVKQSDDGFTQQSFSELVAAEDVRYAQTPDGAKHIFVTPEPAPDVLAQMPAPASGALAQAPASASGALAQALAPASGALAQAPAPASGALAQAPTSASGALAQAPASASGALAQAPSPASGAVSQAASPAASGTAVVAAVTASGTAAQTVAMRQTAGDALDTVQSTEHQATATSNSGTAPLTYHSGAARGVMKPVQVQNAPVAAAEPRYLPLPRR